MQPHFSTSRSFSTFDTHLEWTLTAYAELVLTLGACEVHAPSFGESVAKFAIRTLDPVLLQMLFHAFGLVVRIIGFLPGGKVFAREALVSGFPLEKKLRRAFKYETSLNVQKNYRQEAFCTRHRPAIGTNQFLVPWISDESRRALKIGERLRERVSCNCSAKRSIALKLLKSNLVKSDQKHQMPSI